MQELREVIRNLKGHIEQNRISGKEFIDDVFAALEAIDARIVAIEKRLPPAESLPISSTTAVAGTTFSSSAT